jgi:WD repeat-containing protein 26
MEHNEIVTVCRWFPDGQTFISASVDKEVIVWNLAGTVVHQWSLDRMFDLAITPDGNKMVAICNERKLHIYNVHDNFQELLSYQMPHNMTSVITSNDSKYALINSMAQEVHLWDIEKFQLVRKFVGQRQEKFMIRSCFGGPEQNFVISGSEGSVPCPALGERHGMLMVLRLPYLRLEP